MRIFFRDDGRLRAGWRVTFYLLTYLLGLIAGQLVILTTYSVVILLRGQATMAELTARLLALDLPLGLLAILKVADVLWVLLLTWLFARILDRRKLADYGLRTTKGWLADVGLGFGLGAAQIVVYVAVVWIGGWVVLAVPPAGELGARLGAALLGLVFFCLVALGEELLFRGYVQTHLGEVMPAAIAVGITSLLFALLHGLNANLSWLGMLNIALAGVAMGVGYWAAGSLWLPMAYHLGWNLVMGSLFGLPVSGIRFRGLLIAADYGRLPWLTGDTFGPEGGLLATLLLLGTVGVFWWRGKRKTSFARSGRSE